MKLWIPNLASATVREEPPRRLLDTQDFIPHRVRRPLDVPRERQIFPTQVRTPAFFALQLHPRPLCRTAPGRGSFGTFLHYGVDRLRQVEDNTAFYLFFDYGNATRVKTTRVVTYYK